MVANIKTNEGLNIGRRITFVFSNTFLVPDGDAPVARYDLDRLGWHQFEELIQSLLAADLGLGVESWGGSGDHGRDAYCEHPLHFPDWKVRSNGPFVFQMKFISSANAAGARPLAPLRRAINAERDAIKQRPEQSISHYGLITNVTLTSYQRRQVRETIEEVLPNTQITTMGAREIGNMLDRHPTLRKSFPEILGLRDFQSLLEDIVHRGIRERSIEVAEAAQDLLPVFVSTTQYQRALETLHRHNFVVLDGPPEMGKTAIARMIAFVQFADPEKPWELIECLGPNDFFNVYDREKSQVFIADDAFGRTEYDPGLTRKWERQLPLCHRKLDQDHWLIWTARKHLLEHARTRMAPNSPANEFPSPGEVTIDAGNLLVEEKAKILYRHAKDAGLSSRVKDLIKNTAPEIVTSPHFTPERMRRLVKTSLPKLLRYRSKHFDHEDLVKAILDEIADPTRDMETTYNALSVDHRWILVCLLEFEKTATLSDLHQRFNLLCYSASEPQITAMVSELDGSFLRMSGAGKTTVDWIHPSFRDLVIRELRQDYSAQVKFLSKASVAGCRLALSLRGGAEGSLDLPLLTAPESWSVLSTRILELAQEKSGIFLLNALLPSIIEAQKESPHGNMAELSRAVLKHIEQQLSAKPSPFLMLLAQRACELSRAATYDLDLATLSEFWRLSLQWLDEDISHDDTPAETVSVLDDWLPFAVELRQIYPEVIDADEEAEVLETVLERLVEVLHRHSERDPTYLSDPDDLFGEAQDLRELEAILVQDTFLAAEGIHTLILEANLSSCASRFEDRAIELESENSGHRNEWTGQKASSTEFDINALFIDL